MFTYYLRTTVSLTVPTYYTRLPFLIKKFQRWTAGKFSLYPHVMVALVFLAFTLSSILNLRLRKRVTCDQLIDSIVHQSNILVQDVQAMKNTRSSSMEISHTTRLKNTANMLDQHLYQEQFRTIFL